MTMTLYISRYYRNILVNFCLSFVDEYINFNYLEISETNIKCDLSLGISRYYIYLYGKYPGSRLVLPMISFALLL